MTYVIKKGKKYLEGHGYSSVRGYNFTWVSDIEKAKKFANDDASIDAFKNRTRGAIVELESSR